ncbi:hypothetical protein AAVH_42735 [Aphelenchoides avenae]|nr:hypothetical protein AAVH_42735 [Aphelenchus avenae]
MSHDREFCLTIPLDADKNATGDFYTNLPRKFDLANGQWFCALKGFTARHSWPDLRHVSYGQHMDILLEGNNNLNLDVTDFRRFTPEDLTAAIDRALDKATASYQRIADEYKLEVQKCMQEAVKASKDKPELKSKLRDCDEEKRAARTRRRILAKHGDLEYLSYSATELVSILRSIHINYIPEIDRFSFRTIHPHIKGIQITSALAYALGFSNADGMQRGGTLGRWPPAQFVSEIAIFADFVAPRILGEHLEPLLDVIPIDGARNTSLIDRTHPLPDFCRAGVTELNEMRLSLRTLSGKPLNNLQGTIICKLLFRQNQS